MWSLCHTGAIMSDVFCVLLAVTIHILQLAWYNTLDLVYFMIHM